MAPSLLETVIFLIAIATLPTVCILRGTERSRQLGIVLALGGGMGLACSIGMIVWGHVNGAASLGEAWEVLVANDLFSLRWSWRIVFGAALAGMIVSWLSYLTLGPWLIPQGRSQR